MARTRMITRTIKATMVQANKVNLETHDFIEDLFILEGVVSLEEALPLVQKKYNTKEEVIVQVTGAKVIEQLYGMPEAEFMLYAKPLDENRKVIDDEDEDEQNNE